MRNLLRNQQPVFYKLYKGREEIIDEYGNPTGSYIALYGPLQSAMLCVSPNKGNSEAQQFGTLEDYDRTMTTADTTVPIDENSVLWVDGADADGPYNYIVKRRAPWLNSIQYAIKQVAVSEYKREQELFQKAKEIAESKARRMIVNADHQTEAEYGIDQPSTEGSQGVPQEGSRASI